MDGLLETFGHMPAMEALPIVGPAGRLPGAGVRAVLVGACGGPAADAAAAGVLAPLLMVAIELGMPQMFPYYLAISQAFVPA